MSPATIIVSGPSRSETRSTAVFKYYASTHLRSVVETQDLPRPISRIFASRQSGPNVLIHSPVNCQSFAARTGIPSGPPSHETACPGSQTTSTMALSFIKLPYCSYYNIYILIRHSWMNWDTNGFSIQHFAIRQTNISLTVK